MRSFALFFLACAVSLFSLDEKSPEQIQQELNEAEAQYKQAKEMFNPYYQGPLITPSANMTPPGAVGLQPYVFVKDAYAAFDQNRESIGLDHNLITLNPQINFNTGITNTMDMALTVQGDGNWQNNQSGGGFGDITMFLGFPITLETRYVPAFKFTIGETFPTGRYENLSSNPLLGSTGGGSFQTTFAIAFSKLLFWTTQHPVNVRGYCGYVVPSIVSVSGFNTYGGGFNTKGIVRPGNTLNADLGIEVSITQRLVFCTDLVYTATNITKFHGYPGLTATGDAAVVGSPYSDNLSLSPGFEYNWSPSLGILGGVWFSVYGRNSFNFAAGVISVSYSYP